MKARQVLKALGTTLLLAGASIASLLLSSPRGRADDREEEKDSRIERGFDIAPVPLDLEGKNRRLVGLGSYIVNTEGCDDCHSAGPPTEYLTGHNPYFGLPKMVNPKTHLGGDRNFGELTPMPVGSAHIVSRNLTPTPKTGLPEGDHTFAEFLQNHEDRQRFRSPAPDVHGGSKSGLRSEAVRWRPVANHAMAEFQGLDRPRHSGDLRVFGDGSLRSRELSRRARGPLPVGDELAE
jgi:hypothetical protein